MAEAAVAEHPIQVRAERLHVRGHKRLRLPGLGAERKAISLQSSNSAIADAHLIALYDGPKGEWTLELNGRAVGEADVTFAVAKEPVALIHITVVSRIDVPAAATEAGLWVRLFLAENITPEPRARKRGVTASDADPDYNRVDSRRSMERMKRVVINRLEARGKDFHAAGARTIVDIVRAPGQFEGFSDYPSLAAEQAGRIARVVHVANDDNNPHQSVYADFLADALSVAEAPAIPDPSSSGLIGWRKVHSGSPGAGFVAFEGPLLGNQFYARR